MQNPDCPARDCKPAILTRFSMPASIARGLGMLVALGLVGLGIRALRGTAAKHEGEDEDEKDLDGRQLAAAFVFLAAVPWAMVSPTCQ